MRKVMFNKWQTNLWDLDANDTDAKAVYQDKKPEGKNVFMLKEAGYEDAFSNLGYFHEWSSLQQTPLAIIEDTEGNIHQIPAEHMRFISPPEEPDPIDEAKEYGLKGMTINTADGGKIHLDG